MKNFILTLLLSIFWVQNQFAFGIGIAQVSVTNTSSNTISVYVKVGASNGFSYGAHSYSINGNVITLDICFYLHITNVLTTHEGNYTINGLSNVGYTLVVNANHYDFSTATVCLDNSNSTYGDSKTLTFTMPFSNTIHLSNNDIQDEWVSIFPNPVKDKLSIGSYEGVISEILFYNTLGKQVMSYKIDQKLNDIDVSSLKTGIYFISIIGEKGKLLIKFIKE